MTVLHDLPRLVCLSALGLAAIPAFLVVALCMGYLALLGKLSTWVAE